MKINNNVSKKIQICRAIAIIAVVTIHNCLGGYYGVILRPLINFCVAVFLFLSGLLTSDKVENYGTFYKKRLLRVLIPYTIWSIIYTVYYGNYELFFFRYLTGQCCNIYYYILVYIQLTLLVPIIIKILHSKYWIIGFGITPITIIIQYFLLWDGHQVVYPWNAIICLVWFIFFYFGMCVRSEKIKIKLPFKKSLLLWIITITLQYIESFAWFIFANNNNMATTQIKISSMLTSMSVSIIMYIWITDEKNLKENIYINTMITIGNYSFGIYMSHILLMNILAKSLYQIIPIYFPFTILIILFVEIILVSIFIKIFGDKISKGVGFI